MPPFKKAKVETGNFNSNSINKCKYCFTRSVNPGRTWSNKPYDTCCRNCAVSKQTNPNKRPHSDVCNQRFNKESVLLTVTNDDIDDIDDNGIAQTECENTSNTSNNNSNNRNSHVSLTKEFYDEVNPIVNVDEGLINATCLNNYWHVLHVPKTSDYGKLWNLDICQEFINIITSKTSLLKDMAIIIFQYVQDERVLYFYDKQYCFDQVYGLLSKNWFWETYGTKSDLKFIKTLHYVLCGLDVLDNKRSKHVGIDYSDLNDVEDEKEEEDDEEDEIKKMQGNVSGYMQEGLQEEWDEDVIDDDAINAIRQVGNIAQKYVTNNSMQIWCTDFGKMGYSDDWYMRFVACKFPNENEMVLFHAEIDWMNA